MDGGSSASISNGRLSNMRDTTTANRAAAIEVLFAQICRATPQEARDLSMMLNASERAEMALFCYGKSHAREQGRAIASACTPESLIRAGGAAGQALALRVEVGEAAGEAIPRPERKRVSLAGR